MMGKDYPGHVVSPGMTPESHDQGFQICRTIMHIKDSSLHISMLLSSARAFISHQRDSSSLCLGCEASDYLLHLVQTFMMRAYPSYPKHGGRPSLWSDRTPADYASPREGRAPNHLGSSMADNQHDHPTDPNTICGQHRRQGDPYFDDEIWMAEQHRADRPSVPTGSSHRLLQTTPPPDGIEWTRKAAYAHGIDPEVMRIIIWNLSADEFEDILAHYLSRRAYRATHGILAVYIRYHKIVPTAQEFSMVMKADAPFEEFALNTGPSGFFWADWQNSQTLDDWRLVALAIFIKLGEEKAAHRTEESKSDRNHVTYADDEYDGELSDDILGDSSQQSAPQGRIARGSTTHPRRAIMKTASGRLFSSELGGRDEEKGQAHPDHDDDNGGQAARLRCHYDLYDELYDPVYYF